MAMNTPSSPKSDLVPRGHPRDTSPASSSNSSPPTTMRRGTEADRQQADLKKIAVEFYGKMQAAESQAMQLPLSAACKALGCPAGTSFDKIRLTITGRWQTVAMEDATKVTSETRKEGRTRQGQDHHRSRRR